MDVASLLERAIEVSSPANDGRVFICLAIRPVEDAEARLTPEAMLERARELLTLGFPHEAAGGARVALEMLLARVCRQVGIWPTNPRTGLRLKSKQATNAKFLLTLELAGDIGPEGRRKLKRALLIGNRGAHGKAMRLSDALEAIETATDYCKRWPPTEVMG